MILGRHYAQINPETCEPATMVRPPKRAKQAKVKLAGVPRMMRDKAWQTLQESGFSTEDIGKLYGVSDRHVRRQIAPLKAMSKVKR